MVLILCGKSGVGKDAILKQMVERGYTPIISTTTRPIRDGETDGVEYNFITRGEFEELMNNDGLVEYRKYDTLVGGVPDVWWYGIVKQELSKRDKYVVILDVDGAKAFINYYGKENCYVEYITAPDAIRTERAKQRGSFDEYEWERRVKADNFDFRDEVVSEISDVTIDNSGNLEDCVDEVEDYFFIHRFDSCL